MQTKKVDWLTQTQVKSLVDGGSMFLEIPNEDNQVWLGDTDAIYYDEIAKLQIGDEFYVQEFQNKWDTVSGYDNSRVKGKIKNVRLVRVQEVFYVSDYTRLTGQKLLGHNDPDFNFKLWIEVYFNKVCQEKNLNITYEDNPYIILYEIEV